MKTTILTTLFAGAITAAAAPDYTLHEWGTFTTLCASDGVLMAGVQKEEEPLPEFVQSHEGMPPISTVTFRTSRSRKGARASGGPFFSGSVYASMISPQSSEGSGAP